MFNSEELRHKVIAKAAEQFGYDPSQVKLRLYVGKFAGGPAQRAITEHLAKMNVQVFDIQQIIAAVRTVTEKKTYVNDPVVMTLKALSHAGH